MPALPTVGDPAPKFETRDARGKRLCLVDLRGRPVVLIFLRHLGCPICRMEMAQLRQRHGEFAAAGAEVVVIVDSPPERVAAFARREDVGFRLVGDSDRRLFQRYGVRRGGLRQIAAPGAALRSVRATLGGHLHGRFEGDERQLPAAVVIDAEGVVRYARLGAHVGDNPPLDDLLDHCRRR